MLPIHCFDYLQREKQSTKETELTEKTVSQSQGTRLHLSFPCPDFSYGDGNHTKRAKKTFDQLGCDSRVGQ